MPVYVYECDSCGNKFEEKQSFNDEPLNECPKCGGKVHRVIFATPVHYKGAGFSITESRGLTGKKRKPKIKVGTIGDLPPEEREKYLG
ncbi:MAG: FmdB family zinc ribbon protein [Bacilli bacterium]